MTTTSAAAATAPAARSTRSPLAVRLGAALLALTATASTVGLVLFSLVWGDDPAGPTAVFTAFMLATAATALAAIPSLLRGSALGWALTFGWGSCYTYWSVYKVFGELEYESFGFLAAGTGIVALLASRSARVHAGIAR